MTLFKVSPQFDQAIIKIIKKDSKTHILFIKLFEIKHIIIERLKKHLSQNELTRIHFQDLLPRKTYYRVLQRANVILETFPVGGEATVLQAMATGTPYITLEDELLRTSFETQKLVSTLMKLTLLQKH